MFAIAFVQHSYAQGNDKQTPLTQLLQSYYDIKNALVNSNAIAVASKAGEFRSAINNIDMKALPETGMETGAAGAGLATICGTARNSARRASMSPSSEN